ncbi:MAG: hypothetical protein HXX10_07350 [Rhodoplanes sp.]|uniref:hypothetical protein n=1 Tax=Rhodoplanes sp. TaxID=1968906 RepID=UPI00179F3ED6|nr:hypothetical protein [Rhodoplanes sp.]NVO13835.1 hypothetical protein [Rhodoplanes sp.]
MSPAIKLTFNKDPQGLLRDLRLSEPRASERAVRDAMIEVIERDPGFLGQIFTYWWSNHYRRAAVVEPKPNTVVYEPRPIATRAIPAEKPAERRAAMDSHKAAFRALMDRTLSMTFGDCARHSGFLREVSKHGRPNEIVGKKLTEGDLTNLWNRVAAARAA